MSPTREVRFAVVLYGGVSLAIYMNGVSQELLRMVRGSSGLPPDKLDKTERIYRRLAATPSGSAAPAAESASPRTRFVIDIISGTSAGGINGVALAKALVAGCRDLEVLRKVWVDEADIGALLNDGGLLPGGRKTSLLDNSRMYRLILDTLRRMNAAAAAPAMTGSLVDTLDLFVTATDLAGLSAPIQLTAASIDERIHKSVFHFEFDDVTNDFTEDHDPMLAFAARCTSSFPIAFEPMRFQDIPPAERQNRDLYAKFFPGPRARGEAFEDRQFADGGYLDNRPFSYAVNLIPFRPLSLPGERKLLFVDPFPEEPGAAESRRDYDFLENARLASSVLPRREVIRDDIRAVTAINRRLERLHALQQRWEEDMRTLGPLQPAKPARLEDLDLQDLVQAGFGGQYPLYHHLRVYGTSDTLAEMATRIAGYEPESDELSYLRLLVRAWRDATYSAYRTEGRESENAFLARYDIDFRLRRLNHLSAQIDAALTTRPDDAEPLKAMRARLERELRELRAVHRGMRSPDALEDFTEEEAGRLRAVLGARYQELMGEPDRDRRRDVAAEIYRHPEIGPLVDKALKAIGRQLRRAFDGSSARVRQLLADNPAETELARSYDEFHWHDVMTLPFLEGTGVEEHTEIQVFRVSPADSGINDSPKKLAGIAVGAFGGFLNRDWREHDILWGRLDGAERIVTALLPAKADAGLREAFVAELHDAILEAEYGEAAGSARKMALLKRKLRDRDVGDEALDDVAAQALGVKDAAVLDRARFVAHYSEVKPLGPAPREVADWSGRAARILGRMIDDLPDTGSIGFMGGRVATGLRTGGVLTARLAQFAMPGSFWRLQADWLLLLALVVSAVMLGVGMAIGNETLRTLGGVAAVVVLAAWFLLYHVGRVLTGRTSWPAFVRVLAGAVVAGLALFGAYTLWKLL